MQNRALYAEPKDGEAHDKEIVVQDGKGGRDQVPLLLESMLWLVTSMQEIKALSRRISNAVMG